MPVHLRKTCAYTCVAAALAATASTTYAQFLPPPDILLPVPPGRANDDVINVGPTNYTAGVTGNLLSDDIITGGISLETFSTPPSGTLTLANDGSYRYIPPPNYSGIDTFTYRFCNANVQGSCSNDATVIVEIDPNPQPDTFRGPFNTTLNGNVGSNDPNPSLGGVAYTFRSTSQPAASAGTLSTLDPATGDFTFTPSSSFSGTTSFDYEICATYTLNRLVCTATTASIVIAAAAGTGTSGIQAVPTMSVWGLVALSPLVLGAAGYVRRRQQKQQA